MQSTGLKRREFLVVLAGVGIASEKAWSFQSSPKPSLHGAYRDEGARVTAACMRVFWDGTSRMFRAPVLSSETVRSDARHDRGYTLWPSLVAMHALIEGEKFLPHRYASQIAEVYDGLEQYYSPDLHAYTSWVHFEGNRDAYHDDNSWAVIVLVEAYLVCHKSDTKRAKTYLERAKTIMADYVAKGRDMGVPGGMSWGTDATKPNTSDRGTSSTAGSALAALMLARAGVEADFYTSWGHSLLSWLEDHLQDQDGLVMDALVPPRWEARRVKWSYNTGVPMRAYIEHYRLTKNVDSLTKAARLAKSAINLEGGLFDSKVREPNKRFFWDGTYFVHYLVDGLLQVAMATRDARLKKEIYDAIARNTEYARTHLKDAKDGLYWRNMRLYVIGREQREDWQKWTGQTIVAEYDASERSQEGEFQALPVEERPLVKTLLANAGAARLFWLASQVPERALREN